MQRRTAIGATAAAIAIAIAIAVAGCGGDGQLDAIVRELQALR